MKLKKIILITAFLGGVFYSAPARSETKYLPYDKCSPSCLQYEFCEMTPHPGKEATYDCEKRFADGVACEDSVQCQSGNCGIGQGDEKKCLPPFAQETGAGYLKFAPIAPTIEIKIPTLQPFTTKGLEQPDAEGNIYFPFIGQYIVGIYKWMLLVAGIIATIMIILGGFTYLTSGGNATQAGQGKERIGAAIFGLILLLGSYLMLYLLNPDLVQFKSLKINVIERKELSEPMEDPPADAEQLSATITPCAGSAVLKPSNYTIGKKDFFGQWDCLIKKERNLSNIKVAVIHEGSTSVKKTIGIWKNYYQKKGDAVGAHYIIDRNGEIYQIMGEEKKALHANSANATSIGIDLIIPQGCSQNTSSANFKTCANYTDIQYASLQSLITQITTRTSVQINDSQIIGHCQVKDTTHADPRGFQWEKIGLATAQHRPAGPAEQCIKNYP